ncbi:branched-chain amino acid aminotransferase [Gorillibacterium timonense]|uniref:branched-chain amino acid aminotransferase n=1 Tax=Gorillibacterium timonense TaxID=1689269 RepID=UPI00071E395F|nr:branched-chain amino acid aminotransferase [Gorillibacterium timonense]
MASPAQSTAIRIVRSESLKPKPDPTQLGFGRIFTDHMLLVDYTEGKGWHDARIVPYGPFSLDPSAMVFHYGQTVFEGMKAFKAEDGRILLFRPDRNAARFNVSCERLNIPAFDEAFFVESIRTLIEVEQDWVPNAEGSSLYIRPFVIATEAGLGVRPSNRYLFSVILSPSGAYYSKGLSPVHIRVEDEYVRSVRGGTGFAKTAGNYAASLKAQVIAKEKDHCDQVLWLDGIEQRYIEEVGSMNVFFKVGGEVITPALNGSILDGITRQSVIGLLKEWGIPVTERKISIEELAEAYKKGELEEAFGTGTAAVISPVGRLSWKKEDMRIGDGTIGELSHRLYDAITGIQTGKMEDTFGWNVQV